MKSKLMRLLYWWFRKRLALLMFDIGHVLIMLGAKAEGQTEAHREYLRWEYKIERRALVVAFDGEGAP